MTRELRRLPAEVRTRLGGDTLDTVDPHLWVRQGHSMLEARTRPLEFRIEEGEDGTRHAYLEGYATVYDTAYDVAGGPPWGWSEIIAGGACTRSVAERDDVRYLVNHDGLPFARTSAGTLDLKSDDVGLHCRARVNLERHDAHDLVIALGDGDVSEMSFAFEVLRQEWNGDYTERRILEVRLADVSVVTYPANPFTHVQLERSDPPAVRSLSLARAQLDAAAGYRPR